MWAEGFDTVLPAGWVVVNQSSPVGATNWFQGDAGVFTSHSGADNSYIAANFLNTDPLGGSISDYLITPQFSFGPGSSLSFWTRTEVGSVFPDRLDVLLSTNGGSTTTSDFTNALVTINAGLALGGYPDSWTQYVVDLSAFSGSGRIAFRYDVPDTTVAGDYIGLDDVQVVPEPMTCIMVGTGLVGMISRRRKLAK